MAEETTAPEAEAGEAQAPQQQFTTQRIYLKDLSFECPKGAEAFAEQWKPNVNQQVNTSVNKLAGDNYEVVLGLTVTVKHGEETLYLVEVQQAGIFTAVGFDNTQLPGILNVACPSILFPYARETIDSVVVKGTFPALMVPPINFEQVFAQALKNAQAKAAASAS